MKEKVLRVSRIRLQYDLGMCVKLHDFSEQDGIKDWKEQNSRKATCKAFQFI